jgi:alkanesulfonate monooxygenase SsuD/methylene tetrahydromethanopterin reductase-like flavin-dependent oxidoreductase (luciferase family)
MARPQFGFCVPIFAQPGFPLFRTPRYAALDPARTLRLAREADRLGYDALWVADHLMLGKDAAILEGWTTLAVLAGATARARLGMIHQAHFFRAPALAAKMMATLDQLSGGRFTYFIDGGNRPAEYHAHGLPWEDDIAARAAHMVEGVELALALWRGTGPVTWRGAHYAVADAICRPPPLQQPHPPIWMGGTHPVMLAACARHADCWNTTPVSVSRLHEHLHLVRAACADVGRSPDSLEISLEIQVLIVPDRAGIRRVLREIAALTPGGSHLDPGFSAFIAGSTNTIPESIRETTIIGTPDEVTEQLRAYMDAGVGHFMLWFLDAPGDAGMRLFAREVLPRFG